MWLQVTTGRCWVLTRSSASSWAEPPAGTRWKGAPRAGSELQGGGTTARGPGAHSCPCSWRQGSPTPPTSDGTSGPEPVPVAASIRGSVGTALPTPAPEAAASSLECRVETWMPSRPQGESGPKALPIPSPSPPTHAAQSQSSAAHPPSAAALLLTSPHCPCCIVHLGSGQVAVSLVKQVTWTLPSRGTHLYEAQLATSGSQR